MNKDAYFFSHDSNSKDDPKCVMLIEQLGLEGYGIFWILVETLRDQPEYKYPLSLIPAIARRYNTTTQKVEAVVKTYNLFKCTDDDFFFSASLVRRMEFWEAARLKKSIAGKKGNQMRWDKYKAIAEESQCDNSAITVQSQSIATKLNDTKLKETIPYKEIVDYLNLKTNKTFKAGSKATKDIINARYNDKFTLEDFKKVIDIKSTEWNHIPLPNQSDMRLYLRPQTLFSNKFEGYLNQVGTTTAKEPTRLKAFDNAY